MAYEDEYYDDWSGPEYYGGQVGDVYRDESGVYTGQGTAPQQNDLYTSSVSYAPTTMRYNDQSYTDQVRAQAANEAAGQFREMDSWNASPRMGGGGGFGGGGAPAGPRGIAAMQPQMLNLGQPERTLYDRYRDMLLNPQNITGDPAYQFMFNQGEQALKRSLAAQRLSYSGKSLNDTMAYGAGKSAELFKTLLPSYLSGAQHELQRFSEPASLLPRYAAQNTNAINAAGSAQAARDLIPMFSDAYGGGGRSAYSSPSIPTGAPTSSIGWGGVNTNSSYTPPRLAASYGDTSYMPEYTGMGPVSSYYNREDTQDLYL